MSNRLPLDYKQLFTVLNIDLLSKSKDEIFDILVREKTLQFIQYAFAKCKCLSLSEDLVQDTWETAYENFEKMNNPAMFLFWYKKILDRNIIHHFTNTSQRNTRLFDFNTTIDEVISDIPISEISGYESLISDEVFWTKFEDHVDKTYSEQQKNIFRLKKAADLRYDVIATVLKTTPANAKNQFHRMKGELRKYIRSNF